MRAHCFPAFLHARVTDRGGRGTDGRGRDAVFLQKGVERHSRDTARERFDHDVHLVDMGHAGVTSGGLVIRKLRMPDDGEPPQQSGLSVRK
jgi:hypothetical protein